MLHSRHIAGALAFYDGHLKSIVDAVGAGVVKYVNDFVALPASEASLGDWTVTLVEAGVGETTVTPGDSGNGVLLITTDAADNDGANLQLNGESFKLEANKPLYFGARIQAISDATQSDLFVGLAITDTDILGGVTDRIGFESLDGATALDFVVEKDSAETKVAGVATLADATAITLEFYWDGAALEAFVNGVSVATPALANLPNDEELRVSLQFLTGAAAAKTCGVDWIRVFKFGRQ
jgi:hypothetical protein